MRVRKWKRLCMHNFATENSITPIQSLFNIQNRLNIFYIMSINAIFILKYIFLNFSYISRAVKTNVYVFSLKLKLF